MRSSSSSLTWLSYPFVQFQVAICFIYLALALFVSYIALCCSSRKLSFNLHSVELARVECRCDYAWKIFISEAHNPHFVLISIPLHILLHPDQNSPQIKILRQREYTGDLQSVPYSFDLMRDVN